MHALELVGELLQLVDLLPDTADLLRDQVAQCSRTGSGWVLSAAPSSSRTSASVRPSRWARRMKRTWSTCSDA